MKTLMIVGAGRPQLPAFHAARTRGLRVVALDGDPDAPGLRLADAVHTADARDLEAAVAVARQERVDGVLTLCTDAPVRTVAAICRALGLRGLTPEAALRVTHKGHMREALAKAGVPVPRFRRAFDLEDARAAAQELGFPLIVKPVGGSDCEGVYKVERSEQLDEAYAYSLSASRGGAEILVEEYVDGPEVSVETLSHRGQHHIVTITDMRASGDPHRVELGHAVPSQLPRVAQTQIKVTTLAGLDALGVMDSAAHVEVRLSRRGPRIIEIGARLGGDCISTELVPRATGVDMVAGAIDLALGEVPSTRHTRYGAAAICYLSVAPGRVCAITGVEEARRCAGVGLVEVLVAPGDRVRPVRSSPDRPGYVVAEGDEPAVAVARAEAAAALVQVTTAS